MKITSGGNYRLARHTADMMVRASGGGYKALFQNAAYGLAAVFCVEARKGARRSIRLRLQMPDLDALLAAWLNEIAYYVSTGRVVPEKLVAEEICLNKDGARLAAVIHGRRPLAVLHMREVKAVTLHGLKIRKRAGKLQVSFIADI